MAIPENKLWVLQQLCPNYGTDILGTIMHKYMQIHNRNIHTYIVIERTTETPSIFHFWNQGAGQVNQYNIKPTLNSDT